MFTVSDCTSLAGMSRLPEAMPYINVKRCRQESFSSKSILTSCEREIATRIAPITFSALQMVVYMQQQQHDKDGMETQDELSAFIRSTVTIHSLITDRIDKLQPSQQLTLKVIMKGEAFIDCSAVRDCW